MKETMTKKELGKITSAEFGTLKARPFLLGIWLVLEGKGWGCCVNQSINMSELCKWEDDVQKHRLMDRVLSQVNQLLTDANVNKVSELVGKPIEFINNGPGTIVNWDDFRILTEVL